MTEPPSPAPSSLDGTVHEVDPRMRTVWAIGYALPGLTLALAGVVVGVVQGPAWGGALAVLGVAWLVAGILWAVASWRRWHFRAWPDALELQHGVLTHRTSLVPYARIQQIDVQRGPLERMLGLSSLVLRTAAATTDATVPGVAAEHAEQLRLELCRRAGIDDVV